MNGPEQDARRPRIARAEALFVLAVIAAIFAIRHLERRATARRPWEGAAAIGALKTINTSQTLFRESDMEGDGTLDYGNLQELGKADLVDGVLGSGEKQGFRYDVRASAQTPELLWFAVANPAEPGVTGDRYYCTNHAGIIYYTGTHGRSIAIDAGGPECTIPPHLLPVGK